MPSWLSSHESDQELASTWLALGQPRCSPQSCGTWWYITLSGGAAQSSFCTQGSTLHLSMATICRHNSGLPRLFIFALAGMDHLQQYLWLQ